MDRFDTQKEDYEVTKRSVEQYFDEHGLDEWGYPKNIKKRQAPVYRPEKTFGEKVAEFMVTNPISREVGLGMQGIANASLNPFGYMSRAMGNNTQPLTAENAAERAVERGAQWGYDFAVLRALMGLIPGAETVLAAKDGGMLSTVASGVGGGMLSGAVNLQEPAADAGLAEHALYATGNVLLGGMGASMTSSLPATVENITRNAPAMLKMLSKRLYAMALTLT